jgi:hypothetical protein
MRTIYKLAAIAPLFLVVGCTTHRYSPYPVHVATVRPAEEVVVVPAPAPVSDRPVVRVYPDPITTTATLPPGVSATEYAIAERIRATFNDDPGWKSLTDRVEVRVSGDKVTLRGVVVNDSVRDRIEDKIRDIDGVGSVDNGLTILP